MPRPYEEPRHDPPYHPYTTHKSLQRWESLWEQDTPLTGTNYPTRTSILADLADEDGPLLRPVPNVSFHTAVRHLVSLHDSHRPLSPAQAAAVARLRTLHALNSSGEWFADLPCKIFTDLDTLLFGSKLRGNVCVRYCTIKSNPETAEDSAGVSAPGEYMTTAGHLSRRLFLTINADRLIIDGRRTLKDLVGALVHEMTHAYHILLVGSSHGMRTASGDAHGPEFRRCIDAVGATLRHYTGFRTMYAAPESWYVEDIWYR